MIMPFFSRPRLEISTDKRLVVPQNGVTAVFQFMAFASFLNSAAAQGNATDPHHVNDNFWGGLWRQFGIVAGITFGLLALVTAVGIYSCRKDNRDPAARRHDNTL